MSYDGIRVCEVSNPGPFNFRLGFGSVSSFLLHQEYINTVPCGVFAMCETRLSEFGIRRVKDIIRDMNWKFVPG